MNVIVPILLPLLAALLIQVSGRLLGDDPKGNNLRDGLHTLMAIITFFFVTQLVPDVMSGERPSFLLSELFPGGTIEWRVEPLGLLFALVASGLWIVTSIYGFGYKGHEEQNQTRFLPVLRWPFPCHWGGTRPIFSRSLHSMRR